MQNTFELLAEKFKEIDVSIFKSDFHEWLIAGYGNNHVLTEIILRAVPCRVVRPEHVDKAKVFYEWKRVVMACFGLSKKTGIRYPPDFFRKISYRGQISIKEYENLIEAMPGVMKETFGSLILEMTEHLSFDPFPSEVGLFRSQPSSKVSEMKERFESSTMENDFDGYFGSCLNFYSSLQEAASLFFVSVPTQTINVLVAAKIKAEAFANPFDVKLDIFYSGYFHDVHFGSCGSFLTSDLLYDSYYVQVPPSLYIAEKVKQRIEDHPGKTFYVFMTSNLAEAVKLRSKFHAKLKPKQYYLQDHNGVLFKPDHGFYVAIFGSHDYSTELDLILKSFS